MENIIESIKTPVIGDYDVIVAGGGVGGICAAVSAKRNGAGRVLIIEKSVLLGGLATIGLISWYEPLCDGRGNKLMYGMADELLQLAIRYGSDTLPGEWANNPDTAQTKKRFSTHFSHSMFAMALDKFVNDHEIDILFDTCVVKPYIDNNKCIGIIVENKTGRGAYTGKVFIDGTGDADILCRAGVPCINGSNYMTYIAYKANVQTAKKAAERKDMIMLREWVNAGSDLWGKGHPEDKPMIAGVTAEEITWFVLEGRRRLFNMIKNEERRTRDITALPHMAQLRKTRRIDGDYTLTEADEGKFFDDSIAVACDFANPGKCYELPFRLLYNSQFQNLLTVGRSVSASGWAWDVARVIPPAAATGQAAGTAAAICAQNNIPIKEINIGELQSRLTKEGVRIHPAG